MNARERPQEDAMGCGRFWEQENNKQGNGHQI